MPLNEITGEEYYTPEEWEALQRDKEAGVGPVTSGEIYRMMEASRHEAEQSVPRRELYRDYEVDRMARESFARRMEQVKTADALARQASEPKAPQSTISMFDRPEAVDALRRAREIEVVQNRPDIGVTAIGEGGKRTQVGEFIRPEAKAKPKKAYSYEVAGLTRTGSGEDEGLVDIKVNYDKEGREFNTLEGLTPKQVRALHLPVKGYSKETGRPIADQPFAEAMFFPKHKPLVEDISPEQMTGAVRNATKKMESLYSTSEGTDAEGNELPGSRIDIEKIKSDYRAAAGLKPNAKVPDEQAKQYYDQEMKKAVAREVGILQYGRHLAALQKIPQEDPDRARVVGVAEQLRQRILVPVATPMAPKIEPTEEERRMEKAASFEKTVRGVGKQLGIPQDQFVFPNYQIEEDSAKKKAQNERKATRKRSYLDIAQKYPGILGYMHAPGM